MKLKNYNCDKTQSQIVTKLKNSHYDNSISDKTHSILVRTTWHLDNWWDTLWAAFCDLAMFFSEIWKLPVCNFTVNQSINHSGTYPSRCSTNHSLSYVFNQTKVYTYRNSSLLQYLDDLYIMVHQRASWWVPSPFISPKHTFSLYLTY